MSPIRPAGARALEDSLESADGGVDRQGRWFVGYTKPREEARARENLLRQGFECHLPLIHSQKRVNGTLAWRREPLFPRYLFLRPTSGSAPMDRVRSTLGMMGLVQFAGLPATVAQSVIAELKSFGEEFRQALFESGDSVMLVDGPLAGLEGIFERADGDARAIVLLEFLSRKHRVAVPMESVTATG